MNYVAQACLGGILFLLPSSPLFAQPPAERFYVIVFGSQSVPKLPRFSHTWATFIKVNGDAGPKTLQVDTISWYPASLRVRTFALRPEPGVNLDLETTLGLVLAHGERVSFWGPYEILPQTYARALSKKAELESGLVQYQAIDPVCGGRSFSASDCIHALTDLDRERSRLFYSEVLRFGDSASHFIVHELHRRGRIIDPAADHRWLISAIGLDPYPIVQRCYNGRSCRFP